MYMWVTDNGVVLTCRRIARMQEAAHWLDSHESLPSTVRVVVEQDDGECAFVSMGGPYLHLSTTREQDRQTRLGSIRMWQEAQEDEDYWAWLQAEPDEGRE